MSSALTIRGLSRSFGGVFAARDIDLDIPRGQVRGIIGPNGAGKSTLFNLISGHVRPDAGLVEFEGARIERLSPHERARLGISIVFQGARLFEQMTVLDNVKVGAHARTHGGALGAILRLRSNRVEEREILADSLAALERVGLSEWSDRPAEDLPLGQQRRLQIARAVVAKPSLLLLDEPASGLRAAEREQFAQLVEDLATGGMTIILVEHDVALVMRLAKVISVLDLGEVIAEGTPDEIRSNQRVIDAYLGKGAAHAHH